MTMSTKTVPNWRHRLTLSYWRSYPQGMDGDVFGAVSRVGRNAADALVRAVDGGVWDPFPASRCFDILINKANGVPSLPAVLRVLAELKASPLFAVLRDFAADRIDEAVRSAAQTTILDLQLRAVAQSCVLQGRYDPSDILTQFCGQLLDRAIVTPRGGFIELVGAQRVGAAGEYLRPIAEQAAQVLLARPEAKRLQLARRHAQIDADTDLLGASP